MHDIKTAFERHNSLTINGLDRKSRYRGRVFFPFCFCLLPFFGLAQTAAAVRQLPRFDSLSMEGEAIFFTKKYEVILGGRLCHADPEIEACLFSTDVFVVERASKKTWAIPLENLPENVAEHFSAVGIGAATDSENAFFVGGYGYDHRADAFVTFGQLTFFPLEKTIEKLLTGQRADADFKAIVDDRLALFDGRLLKIGDYFLLYNGQLATPIYQEELDRPFIDIEDFAGELRTWRLVCAPVFGCEIVEFKTCESSAAQISCLPKRFYLDEKTRPAPMIEARKQ